MTGRNEGRYLMLNPPGSRHRQSRCLHHDRVLAGNGNV